MPIYTYKGYDAASGANRKGKIEADSPKAARTKLRQRDKVIVAELKEEASLVTAQKKRPTISLGSSVSLAEIAVMTRQFATLQSAHVPLDECLKALTAQVENKVLRNTLSAVNNKVAEGQALADASAAFPGVFNRLYINMVKAGETSGKLDIVLDRLAGFLEDQNATKGKVFSAITYPAVMIIASTGIIAFLFLSVVPKLTKVFDSLRVTLPWYTQMCISLANFLQYYYWLLAIMIVAGYFGFRKWKSTPSGGRKWDEFVLKVPVFGPIILRVMISRFTKTLSTLLNSGVPIIQALDITKNVITNSLIQEALENAKLAVQEGESLGRTIERTGRFPPLVTHMIMTGERTGQLEEMLTHVADAYDAEVENKISAMISLIEPAMIVVLGGITVTVVFSLMIPMLGVMSQLK